MHKHFFPIDQTEYDEHDPAYYASLEPIRESWDAQVMNWLASDNVYRAMVGLVVAIALFFALWPLWGFAGGRWIVNALTGGN